MGTLDYFDNINLSIHKHITLTYPTRMTKAAYENRGISKEGLPVDLYLPWTPEEIHQDLLLNRVLSLCPWKEKSHDLLNGMVMTNGPIRL